MFKYHSDMGHCFSYVVVVKKSKEKKMFFFALFGKNGHGIGKKVAIFDWEWGRNPTLELGRKS